MNEKAGIRAEAERLFEAFQAVGALPVDADILLPAETLLDLYGEDIRARAYMTTDPLQGEMMLRPDFTVPVVQQHMAYGADPARYCYMGEVFRSRETLGHRKNEYLQVGFEVFDRNAPEQADAEVYALFAKLLGGTVARPVTGDIGILMAAVRGLDTSERRKAALLRHIWRPRRFRALLDRFAGRAAIPKARAELLERLATGSAADLMQAAGPFIGLRGPDEVATRVAALIEDADAPPIAAPEAALLYDLLSLQAPAEAALAHLRGITFLLSAIAPAVDRFAARLVALRSRGIDTATLPFEASLGRTSMEYYDGFTFSFLAKGIDPVASGGRYDALTAVLGLGRSIPAVGGVILPALALQVRA
jgi:ATP phosphoribosyltransferase regulatory subunit